MNGRGRIVAGAWFWAAALLAGVMPAAAQNVDPVVPQAAALQPRMTNLLKAIIELRNQGRDNALVIDQRFAAGARVLPGPIPKAGPDAAKILWSLFFRKAQVILGDTESKTPIVGYYNPLVDYWLMTQWQMTDSGAVLTRATLVSGSPDSGEEPGWISHPGDPDPVYAMQKAAKAAMAGFATRYPEAAKQAPTLPTRSDLDDFASRLSIQYVTLTRIKKDTRAAHAVAETFNALAVADAQRLRAQFEGPTQTDLTTLFSAPMLFRSQLEINYVRLADKGFLIWAGRPDNGRWLFVAGYVRQDDGHYRLTRLTLIDLLQGSFP